MERLLTPQLPREPDRTGADLLRATVGTVFCGAIRSAHPGIGEDGPSPEQDQQ
ncbi:hypothetical protein [Saccharopolyspora sp. ASAGF58]|uniref:hypothetical protein n=1 Tax=Saccharopolyspora sp. ASAGF58 TaxID=2719023 RepID=UPI0014458B36|nr:hypothetical protein [Saccharopolyspora sp. ASAGF58]